MLRILSECLSDSECLGSNRAPLSFTDDSPAFCFSLLYLCSTIVRTNCLLPLYLATSVYVAIISHSEFWNNFPTLICWFESCSLQTILKWKNSVKYKLDYEALYSDPHGLLGSRIYLHFILLYASDPIICTLPLPHFSIQGGLSAGLWTHQARSSLTLFFLLPPCL